MSQLRFAHRPAWYFSVIASVGRGSAAGASGTRTAISSAQGLAQQAPFVRFPVVTLMKAATLRSAGLSLLPTGRNPLHFTVGFEDLDEGVDRLCDCEHRTVVNPYHEDESRGTGR